ncbi:MAG: type II toxin-antitoxin system RelE/ParE family toxin [Azospirillaceae bacterium]|nr:type II toxin-antitoxin system RelE/ParE family toxin [Azospirillaceae bacterium]
MEVTFAPAAIADLIHIRRYLGHFNPTAAKRTANRLAAVALSLASFPERGRPRHDGARELTTIPPYVNVYDIAPGRVTILRVWHGAQRRDD